MDILRQSLKKTCWFVFSLFLLTSCATVSETETVTPTSDGQKNTSTQVSPTLQSPSKYNLKRKIVVARFTNETLHGKSVLLGNQRKYNDYQASDILKTRLTKTDQFLIFDYNDPQSLLAAVDQKNVRSLGLPADYAIVGSISQFGRKTTSETGVFSRTKQQKVEATVNVRLVNVRTSQIIFAQEGSGEAVSEVGTVLGVGTKAGYDESLNDKAISAAISKVISNLIENLLDKKWQSYVISREGNTVMIGGGKSQGIAPGHRFVVMERGKTVENPQTGLPIELPGQHLGVIEVVSFFGDSKDNEGSICRIVEGNLPQADYANWIVEEVK